jgi:succinyl-CoA synthetase beta subunit
MRLHEYQSKSLFAKYGIPIPNGRIASSAREVKQISEELGGKVVIKSQVLVGGRGKAGGIRLAKTPTEAEAFAEQILAMEVKGIPVRKVLVDEAVSIDKEIYLSIANDRNSQKPILMASSSGGVDIEETAVKNPEKIIKRTVDPLIGLREYQLRDIAISIDLDRKFWKIFGEVISAVWRLYVDCDATIVEINPLVITADDRVIALDAKIVLDDNSLFRHPDLAEMRDLDAEEPAEIEGRKFGVVFIKLDGNIGCLVNGAGLAMATMDIIKLLGGEPANFLDIGGGASSEKVAAAFRIILADSKVKAILINVFGGITRCDEVAKGILDAMKKVKPKIPVIVRLVGTNKEEGMKMLEGTNLITADSLYTAAKLAIENAGWGSI